MTTEIELTVQGMRCTGCESNLGFALTALAGVERARASHTTGKVEVVFDPERTTELEIREAIEQIGYGVVKGD